MVKKFTANCDFGGQKSPVSLYVGDPMEGNHPLAFQSKWLSSDRGGIVPNEIMDSFAKLSDIAVKNKVSFEELCSYVIDELNSSQTIASDAKRAKEFSGGNVEQNQAAEQQNVKVEPNVSKQQPPKQKIEEQEPADLTPKPPIPEYPVSKPPIQTPPDLEKPATSESLAQKPIDQDQQKTAVQSQTVKKDILPAEELPIKQKSTPVQETPLDPFQEIGFDLQKPVEQVKDIASQKPIAEEAIEKNVAPSEKVPVAEKKPVNPIPNPPKTDSKAEIPSIEKPARVENPPAPKLAERKPLESKPIEKKETEIPVKKDSIIENPIEPKKVEVITPVQKPVEPVQTLPKAETPPLKKPVEVEKPLSPKLTEEKPVEKKVTVAAESAQKPQTLTPQEIAKRAALKVMQARSTAAGDKNEIKGTNEE